MLSILIRIQLSILGPNIIDVRYHWMGNAFDAILLKLKKVHIDDNNGDMMTKTLSRWKLEACVEKVILVVISIKLL